MPHDPSVSRRTLWFWNLAARRNVHSKSTFCTLQREIVYQASQRDDLKRWSSWRADTDATGPMTGTPAETLRSGGWRWLSITTKPRRGASGLVVCVHTP